jgi:hypothetical protein
MLAVACPRRVWTYLTLTFSASSKVAQVWRRSCGLIAGRPARARITLSQPLWRALVAGFGYLLIVRTSIADFTFRGETVGTGLDFAYKRMSQYLLRHHKLELHRKLREDFGRVYKGNAEDPVVFLGAAEFLIAQAPGADRDEMNSKIGLA